MNSKHKIKYFYPVVTNTFIAVLYNKTPLYYRSLVEKITSYVVSNVSEKSDLLLFTYIAEFYLTQKLMVLNEVSIRICAFFITICNVINKFNF